MTEHINPWKHDFETKTFKFKGLSEEDELELMIIQNKAEEFLVKEGDKILGKINFVEVEKQKELGEAQRFIQRVDTFINKVLDNHIVSDTFLYFFLPMQIQNEVREFKLSLKKK